MTTITLKNDKTIPTLGFGTWQLTGDDCVEGVTTAVEVGYRHIDTADAYGNHTEVAAGIEKSGVAREDIFLTSKIFPRDNSFTAEGVKEHIDRFLEELNTDYLDLVLLHWPDREVPLEETLGAAHEAMAEGKVRSVGVSNFNEHHLEDAMETGYEIVMNQVELHPGFPQTDLRQFCEKHDIAVTAYSPIGRGESLEMPLIKELAEKYDKTPGQICINWLLSVDLIAIPKSTKPERIKENFEAQDFTMEQEDIDRISDNTDGHRIIDPDFADFDY